MESMETLYFITDGPAWTARAIPDRRFTLTAVPCAIQSPWWPTARDGRSLYGHWVKITNCNWIGQSNLTTGRLTARQPNQGGGWQHRRLASWNAGWKYAGKCVLSHKGSWPHLILDSLSLPESARIVIVQPFLHGLAVLTRAHTVIDHANGTCDICSNRAVYALQAVSATNSRAIGHIITAISCNTYGKVVFTNIIFFLHFSFFVLT